MDYIERQTIKAPKTAITLSEWRKRLAPDGGIDFIIEALLCGNSTIDDLLWRLPACEIPRATMPRIFKKKMRTLDFVRKHIGSMIGERQAVRVNRSVKGAYVYQLAFDMATRREALREVSPTERWGEGGELND